MNLTNYLLNMCMLVMLINMFKNRIDKYLPVYAKYSL